MVSGNYSILKHFLMSGILNSLVLQSILVVLLCISIFKLVILIPNLRGLVSKVGLVSLHHSMNES